ncbi:hypothetical protein TNIN_305581 [Trichonephila inaurata madagascariensis]|uniref:Uncharacterized protein n=1 Tax=Trichonephila inaurata madagascariensis TaxID=2747483 RepID=A0A8X6XH25_9ARAC|nr:hypothetical protein TNIN_305581 [Trichonephila inaurata madagascariensis]
MLYQSMSHRVAACFQDRVGTQDSSGASSSNIRKPTQICTFPGKNSSAYSFTEAFRNPGTDQNKKVPLQKNVTEFRISERESEFSSSFNFIKLIPPSLKKDIIHLRKFILDDDIIEKTYKAALRYPEGINELLKVLEHMGRFNEKYAEKRSAEEKKFMKWLNIITAKIKYLHLVKISNIKLQYMPALEEIRKIQIEKVNTNLEDADATRKEYRSEDNNPINSLKMLKNCVSRTGDQCQYKNKHLTKIAEYGPVPSKVDRNPSHQNNINVSGTCNNNNSKSFSQIEEKNRLKCSSGIKNNRSEIATKRVQPQTIRQKSFDAEPEKCETYLIDNIINEIYFTHNKNASQAELRTQSSKRISSTTDEFASPNPKSEPCVTAKNFPVTVKRKPNESPLENTEFQTPDAMLSGFLKKKIKTEFNEEEVEKGIKKHYEITITGVKSDALQKSDCKFDITNTLKTKRPRSRFPNGLSSAIKRSKGILKPDVMEAFLTHVKRRKYPRKIAAIYDRDVSKITEQLENIVFSYYHGRTRSSSDDAQISWVMQLIEKLKEH